MANAILLRPLPMAAITASATASGYSADNVGIDQMGVVWNSGTGAATRTMTIDMGADVAIDTIALFGLYAAQASWTWSIDLATEAQGAFGGSFWSGSSEDLLAGSEMPVSGLGRALWLAPSGAPAAARHVRLNFAGLASAALQVSRVCIGGKVQLARNYQFGAPTGVRPLGNVDFSARGVMLRRSGARLRGVGLSFQHIHRDEVEGEIDRMFERVGNDTPIVIVRDPAEHEQRQNRIFFGVLTGNLGTINRRPGGWSADFNLVDIEPVT